MQINSDFSQQATVKAQDYQWVPSPLPGVDRVMLDRIGNEKARATSIVRYAPQSSFSAHGHPGGEEILVLEGIFSDETGDFPQGWYLRNPPKSVHTPFSEAGATIFVKLWQMLPSDNQTVRININDTANWQEVNGQLICPLFKDNGEDVYMQKLAVEQSVVRDNPCAELTEVFVYQGNVEFHGDIYHQGSWIRLPKAAIAADVVAKEQDTMVYVKQAALHPIDSEALR